jgi:PTH1 family peptidyl-tRNA hydrolase
VPIKLIVGLGNPGGRYAATRHNTGFWLVDTLAQLAKQTFATEAKFFGDICALEQEGLKYWLLKPTTFMNRSGQAVAALANYYKIAAEQILVIHDDLDFAPGTVRLKVGGGDGRHNGLKDIIARLGTNQFTRLRLGIGHPGSAGEVSNYVLTAPNPEDKIAIEVAIKLTVDVMPLIILGQLDKAMQQLHTHH